MRGFPGIALAALLLASCSQNNAPSDKIKEAANEVVGKVDGTADAKVTLAQGPYAPQDECKTTAGADAFRTQLAAAIKARDADQLIALAAPDVKLDFGGGSGTAQLRARLGKGAQLWAELDQLMALGCAVNEQGGITIPWVAATPVDGADPATAMLVTGERVPLRAAADASAAEIDAVSWDVADLVGGLQPGAAFQQVKTSDGTTGFVATDQLRSLLDYRLIASSRDGKWSFTSLVRGD